MSLNDAALKSAFKAMMSHTDPLSVDAAADAMVAAFKAYVTSGSVSVTIQPGSIITAGSPATQTGPQSPVNLTGSIS